MNISSAGVVIYSFAYFKACFEISLYIFIAVRDSSKLFRLKKVCFMDRRSMYFVEKKSVSWIKEACISFLNSRPLIFVCRPFTC